MYVLSQVEDDEISEVAYQEAGRAGDKVADDETSQDGAASSSSGQVRSD